MRESIAKRYFHGREWAASALILLAVAMVSLLVSIQILGALHIPVYYAARGSAPQWSIRWIEAIGYTIVASALIDIVGLFVDKRKAMAWLVLLACVISFAAAGAAFE